MRKILIACALKEELGAEFRDSGLNILYTGIGKVNATYALTRALRSNDWDLVVNFGTAGSDKFQAGQVVHCVRIYERDMQCQLPEFWDHNPEFIDTSAQLIRDQFFYPLPETSCFTGDSFLNYFQVGGYDGVVDMEAFALAKVCKHLDVPFLSFKAISDGMIKTESEIAWRENISKSAAQFRSIYGLIEKRFLKTKEFCGAI